MAIVTLAEAKTFLGVTGTDEDARLTLMLSFVDAQIIAFCRQNFVQANYSEFYSGSGTRTVVLRRRPVQSITNVWLDNSAYYGSAPDSFGDKTILVNGTDYALELDETLSNAQVVSRAGLLVRVSTVWPEMNAQFYPGRLTQEYGPSFGNIKVNYVAGYPAAAFPADLKAAASMMISAMRRSAAYGGLAPTSERISDYSYSLGGASSSGSSGGSPEFGSARQILLGYREVPIGETNASAPGSFGR